MSMKTFNINCRMNEDLRDIIDIIKLRKGGLTGFFEKVLREEIPRATADEWYALKVTRKVGGK